MAVRPVFAVTLDKTLFKKENVEFEYFRGCSISQKRKNIYSLHAEYLKKNCKHNVLEISSKSDDELGVKLSAFNLMIRTKSGNEISVESAFQASKVFEKGGPYRDLLYQKSQISKKDKRLKNSGKITKFCFNGKIFEIEPKTYFYNWLYINTLHLNKELGDKLVKYDAFTDIEFNPKKSINCQAEAAAIYVSLRKQELLKEALKDREAFKNVVYHIENFKGKQISFYDNSSIM